jgi:hypothetical protein
MRWSALVLPLGLSPAIARAQGVEPPSRVCWENRAPNGCPITVLTSAGGYVAADTRADAQDALFMRAVVDWGILVGRAGGHDALGLSLFVSYDTKDDLLVAPALRYRRISPSIGILDVALGTPLLSSVDVGTLGDLVGPYGLVKWSPAPSFGVAVRPELRRGLSSSTPPRFVVSLGIELGRVGGLAVAAGGVVLSLVAAAASAG